MIKFEDLKVGQDIFDLYINPVAKDFSIKKARVISIATRLPFNCEKKLLSDKPYLIVGFLTDSNSIYSVDNYEKCSYSKEMAINHKFFDNKKEIMTNIGTIKEEQLDIKYKELAKTYEADKKKIKESVDNLEVELLKALK